MKPSSLTLEDAMKHHVVWMPVILLLAALSSSGCKQASEAAAEEAGPARVEHLQGDEPTRVTLTEEAAKRIDVQTAPVEDMAINGAVRQVVPYAAVLYDTNGDTWVYTNPKPLVFVRHRIVVDYIDGEQAVLSDGPVRGTAVVTVGATELNGAELEFEEE
jgi:hypothetical protein